MPPEQLNTISGKLLLEDRIVKKINNIYKQNIIKELYFSRFLVQWRAMAWGIVINLSSINHVFSIIR